jgi:hypothetical protein|tara:strand:- start:14550 stop:14708 length:159 start_codon:yes stop_codon:yes gene_type:complete
LHYNHNNKTEGFYMTDHNLQESSAGESSLDAMAAVALILIVVVAAVFWVSGQ